MKHVLRLRTNVILNPLSRIKEISESLFMDAKPIMNFFHSQMLHLEHILQIFQFRLLIIQRTKFLRLLEFSSQELLPASLFGETEEIVSTLLASNKFLLSIVLQNRTKLMHKQSQTLIYTQTRVKRWNKCWNKLDLKVLKFGSNQSISCSELEKNIWVRLAMVDLTQRQKVETCLLSKSNPWEMKLSRCMINSLVLRQPT